MSAGAVVAAIAHNRWARKGGKWSCRRRDQGADTQRHTHRQTVCMHVCMYACRALALGAPFNTCPPPFPSPCAPPGAAGLLRHANRQTRTNEHVSNTLPKPTNKRRQCSLSSHRRPQSQDMHAQRTRRTRTEPCLRRAYLAACGWAATGALTSAAPPPPPCAAAVCALASSYWSCVFPVLLNAMHMQAHILGKFDKVRTARDMFYIHVYGHAHIPAAGPGRPPRDPS